MSDATAPGAPKAALWSYAFRPFFLLMSAFAVLSMLVWMFVMHGRGPDFLPANTVYWHSHEMLIGFALAAVAGFTLTAVATWTGRPPVSGHELLLLVLAWIAGRVAIVASGILPAVWVAAIDMLFPVLLAAFLAREIVLAGNRRNYPVVIVVSLFAVFNALYHSSTLGMIAMHWQVDRVALYLLLHLLLALITVIGGRIVPGFTANWLRAKGHSKLPRQGGVIDRLVIPLTLSTGLFATLVPYNPITGYLALGAALTHAWRLLRWRGLSTLSEPLLFVLHVAYAWLPIGYLLTAASVLGLGIPPVAALHALTVGAITLMVLAMSSRVALAHTGRPLHAPRAIVAAYWLMLIAVIARVISPYGTTYYQLLDLAAGSWIACFVIFLWVYGPILLRRRIDEIPGENGPDDQA
ncbi:MAG: NnrS family protein [Gammaproteobacteria bacterium]|nr:NnrS family protein [Gammaproteobacteria bacterium]